MKLKLKRKIFTDQSTIGELYVNDKFECYILEDTDRKLEAGGKKIPTQTCIPRGTYQIVVTHSMRFGRLLPLLVKVPLFEGVRIHPGNKPGNTDGCLLPGTTYSKDWVSNSTEAWANLFDKILACHNRAEEMWITVE